MQAFNFKRQLCAIALLLLISVGASVRAATLSVNCGGKYGLTSINAALKALRNSESEGQATINVSGTCNENVVIQSMNHITLNAVNGASINDPSHGANLTVVIDDSQQIVMNNFVINGDSTSNSDNDVVDCQNGSLCHFNGNTVQNAPQNGGGLGVWAGSYGTIDGGFLQNNTGWGGLVVGNGGRARADGVVTQGNLNGAFIYDGGLLQLGASSTVRNNIAAGIFVSHGTLLCKPCRVTGNGFGNGADGIHLESSSSVSFGAGYSVTGNAGAGISLRYLSGASFRGGAGNVSGNLGTWDIVCNPTFTTADGLANVPGARVTGCP
jgi:hypothetical protein